MIPSRLAPRCLILVNALKSMLFGLPILMLFYNDKGVGIGDFFLIQGISWLFVFLLELPSGYIGDVFSRKYTLLVGLICWIVGYLAWIFGSGFWWILTGELIFAFAISLFSGTAEAYLYDLLRKNNKEKAFHKKLAKLKTIENIGLLISTFSGAFIYQFLGTNAPIWASVFCLCVGIFILLNMPDVPESKRIVEKGKSKIQDILDISRFAVKHPQIKWFIFFPAVYGTLTIVFMWGLQSVMILHSVPVFVFSIIVGMNAVMRTLYASISGSLLEKSSINRILVILMSILILSITGACLSSYISGFMIYVCLCLMIFGSGSVVLANITTSTLINHRIKSDERSTVLSVKSMAGRAMGGIAMLLLKPLFDTVGIGETFMISSALIIPISYFCYKIYQLGLTTVKKTS